MKLIVFYLNLNEFLIELKKSPSQKKQTNKQKCINFGKVIPR